MSEYDIIPQDPSMAAKLGNMDAHNPAPRLPVILMLDTSGSMAGTAINELNRGLRQFLQETQEDATASSSVELEIISFSDNATVEIPFQRLGLIDESTLPTFTAGGNTAMGAAIDRAKNDLKSCREIYKINGFSAYKPWIVLMTDGAPNDNWEKPARELKELCQSKGYTYLGIGVGDAVDWKTLGEIVPDPPGPVKLQGFKFREFFKWITDSLKMTTRTAVDLQDTVQVGSIKDWGELV